MIRFDGFWPIHDAQLRLVGYMYIRATMSHYHPILYLPVLPKVNVADAKIEANPAPVSVPKVELRVLQVPLRNGSAAQTVYDLWTDDKGLSILENSTDFIRIDDVEVIQECLPQ